LENLLQDIIFQGWILISGFSRVYLQGQTKSRVFQGLPGFPGFVGHPPPIRKSDSKCSKRILENLKRNSGIKQIRLRKPKKEHKGYLDDKQYMKEYNSDIVSNNSIFHKFWL